MKPHPTDEQVRSLARVRDEDLAGYADRPAARALLAGIVATAAEPADAARTADPTAPHTTEPATPRTAERVGRRRRVRSSSLRLAAAGTAVAAAAVAGGVVVLQTGGDEARSDPPPAAIRLASAAETAQVLDRAAAAAEKRPSTTPKPDQWVYTKMRLTTGAKPAGLVTGGPYRTEEWELWRRGDGRQYAAYKNGKLSTGHELVSSAVAARYEPLPADPEALLRKVHDPAGGTAMTFQTLTTLLRDTVHPPATEAAIYRAMKRLPGVTLVAGRVDASGRPAIALGMVHDWVHEEVLLDPRTYAYLGERAVAIKDHKVGDDPGHRVRKGTLQRLMVRITAKVVDRPGARS